MSSKSTAQCASHSDPRFDRSLTENVVNAIGPGTTPRNREVLSALIRHLHDAAREVELTYNELMACLKFVNDVGQISDSKRNEAQRVADVLGLESLVDGMAHTIGTKANQDSTSSAILGPFWSPNAPYREMGGSIIQDEHHGEIVLMHGTVSDVTTRNPIADAVVDVWQANTNGKYDFQDPDAQSANNLRGKFRTNAKGEYSFYCLKPTPYSVPTDGPAGTLLNLMDRDSMRPAHIHLMFSHDHYNSLVNQVFPNDDPYLVDDTVFAVKDDLTVNFKPLPEGSKDATLELRYDVTLMPRRVLERPVTQL